MSEYPDCEYCGGEVILDEREGHTVCTYCGTVHDQWCCKEDHDFARHSIVSQVDLDKGDRKSKKQSVIQDMVTNIAMHNSFGTAVMDAACDIASSVNITTIQQQSLSAWALICVGGEVVRAGFQMSDMAKAAEVPVCKLLGAMEIIRDQVKHMLPETACADTNDTLNAVAKVLTYVYTKDQKAEKIVARKYILKVLEAEANNAPFMNITAMTRARVLVCDFLRCHGGLSKDHKKALQYESSGVRNGFKKLSARVKV